MPTHVTDMPCLKDSQSPNTKIKLALRHPRESAIILPLPLNFEKIFCTTRM
jgi:hypothetical protein